MQTLIVLLVAFLCAVNAHRHAQVVLPLYKDSFVYLHVGLPGVLLPFWVRWDVDYIAILPEAQIRSYSRSWAADSTDNVCFGTDCVRLPVCIDCTPPPADPTRIVPDGVRQYMGVLGLGDKSPVWSEFPFWRYSQRNLILMRENHRPVRESAFYPDNFVPVRANGKHFWARIDLSTDYTMLPWSLASISNKRWRLDVYESDTVTRYAKTRIAPWIFVDRAEDGSNVHTMRPGHQLDGMEAATEHNNGTAWNATDTLVLGRRLLQKGFTVQRNTISGATWVTCDWKWAPITSYLAYVTFFLILLPLDLLWLYGIYDSADFASRVGQFAMPMAPNAPYGYVLEVDGFVYPLPPGSLPPPEVPASIDMGLLPVSMLSYRHRRFSTALIVLTQTTFSFVVFTMLLGFGFTDKFWHELFSVQDYVAVYSVVAVGVLFSCSLWALRYFPMVVSLWGDHLVLLTIWLLAAVEPFQAANSFVMLLTSGAVAVHSMHQLFAFLLRRTWPWGTYERMWPLWFVMFVALAAWSSWLFSFYTVVLVTLSWRAENPGVWAIAAASFILVVFLAHRITNERQSVRTALRTAAVDMVEEQTNRKIASMASKKMS